MKLVATFVLAACCLYIARELRNGRLYFLAALFTLGCAAAVAGAVFDWPRAIRAVAFVSTFGTVLVGGAKLRMRGWM